jgi:hypothetical protein
LKLPNADRAIIAAEKLRDYLLNPAHPDNGGKAYVFTALGYSRENWARLGDDFRSQHLTEEAVEGRANAFGRTYVIVAHLQGPLRSATILSVWQIDDGAEVPRFITAYGYEDKIQAIPVRYR